MTLLEAENMPIFIQIENADGSTTFHSPCLFVDDITIPANMIPDIVAIQAQLIKDTETAKNFALAFSGGRIFTEDVVGAINFLSKMPFYSWFASQWGDLQIATVENQVKRSATQFLKWKNTTKFSFEGELKTTQSINRRTLFRVTFTQLRNAFLMWHHLYDLAQEYGTTGIDQWWGAMLDPTYVIAPRTEIEFWEDAEEEIVIG